MAFCSLNYTYYVCKKGIRGKQKWIWPRNTAFFLANLSFVELDMKEICGYAICILTITNLRICKLRTATTQKFANLRLPNEPKILRICDLRTKKKICVPTFGENEAIIKSYLYTTDQF
jgi:hypothetical protein